MDKQQPMVPEHQGVHEPQRKDEQTDEQRAAVKLVDRLYQKARKARSKSDMDWPTYFRYFRGDQWQTKRPSYRHSEVINITTANIRNIVPVLTDPQPQVTTTPEDPTDFEFSQIMNQVISSKWDRDNTNMIVAECIIDACVTGTALAGVPWVESLAQGLGDYVVESEDIAHCFPDPTARDMNDRRGKFLVIAEPVDVQELREDYPDFKERIKPDLSDPIAFNSYNDEATKFEFKSPVDNRMITSDSRSVGQQGNPDLVLKFTAYILSNDVISQKECEIDHQTGEKKETEYNVKKYPNGRKIVVANNLCLEDDEIKYEDGRFPYARLVNDIIPRCFFGEGEIGPQKSPQDITNKLISYLLDYLIIMGNPYWVIDSEAQVDVDNITNEPGQIIVKKKAGTAQQVPGLSPPPFILNTLQYFMQDVFSKISGNNEISQGALTKANLSGEAITQLTEASQTRLRAKARNLDAFLNQLGQLIVSRILQFYNLPRVVRVTGDQGTAAKYFKFSVQDQPVVGEDGKPVMIAGKPKTQKVASYQQYHRDEANGNVSLGPVKNVPLKGALDVRISTGTALPFMKAKRDSQAERLFDKGVLDAEDFLTNIEYPNRENIISKWKERQAAAAAANQEGAEEAPAEQVGG